MKISDLIEMLKCELETHGDVEAFTDGDYGWYDPYLIFHEDKNHLEIW